MSARTFYIYTLGCQMNVYDAERVAAALRGRGWQDSPVVEEADLVVVHTCAVRAKAEQKAFRLIGRLEPLKRRRPGILLAVGGCVAQQQGERLLERAPHVDLVFGTHAVARFPALVERRLQDPRPLVDVVAAEEPAPEGPDEAHPGPSLVSRYVTIMRGCDNFCAYCVVPHVRGPERSRPAEEVLAEVRACVAAGAREVVLLGQNVNSYGAKEGWGGFARLLERVNAVEGLRRIRFTTSHPKDLTDELISAFGRLEKLCPHIHLPVQSGSDRVLAAMNRRYTRAHYLDKVSKLRDSFPGIAITSDLIVGFPGETAEDFAETLSLLRHARFDGVFAFMYSDRPNTPAAGLEPKVPPGEKRRRLQMVLGMQEEITSAIHLALVGTRQEVLVEGPARLPRGGGGGGPAEARWTGRTAANKIVHVRAGNGGGRPLTPGACVAVRIERAHAHSLSGVLDPG